MVVTTSGFGPPLDRLSACCLLQITKRPRRAEGGSFRLACARDRATWLLVPLGGLEPPPHGLRTRHAALTPHRGWSRHGGSSPDLGRTRAACFRCHHGDVERVAGFEPVIIGLEARGPTVGRHSLWFGLRVSIPSLHADNVGCNLHTQAEHGPVPFTGPSTRQLSKTPPSASTAALAVRMATAPGFEPGPASFGGSDAPVTPRCLRHRLDRFEDDPPLRPGPCLLRACGQNKKGLLGDRPRRPGSL